MGSLILVTFALLQLYTHTLGLNFSWSRDCEPTLPALSFSALLMTPSQWDINPPGGGALYAELVKNRAFQGQSGSATPNLDAYRSVGEARISIDAADALSFALPNVLRVTPTDMTSTYQVGFLNTGYPGIRIGPAKCTSSPYVKCPRSKVFAQQQIMSNSGAVSRPVGENRWSQICQHNGLHGAGGLRADIVQKLEAVKPRFLRWGGNNLEGNHPPYRWKWNETIGLLIDRPGRQGARGYENTDGLGLIECMQLADGMGLEPILGIWVGSHLNGPVIPQDELGVYRSTTSTRGAVRARVGYPNPWKLDYVGMGNKGDLGEGMASYNSYRPRMFLDAIKAAYLDMKIMASNIRLNPVPEGAWLDYHVYMQPDEFIKLFNFFGNIDRSRPMVVGEYACVQGDPLQRGGVDRVALNAGFPTVIGAAAEAVFMIGMEGNADLVGTAAYAPLLQSLDGYQWSVSTHSPPPNLASEYCVMRGSL
ncbi:Glycoside Hydrolase Family 51 protein [Tuber magnatum]|uniref:Glycoside Hydrolase Family 51 protein n=1 Tax=Tuber magnatum TaxID=42249 RepID=A0A317SWJ4_9PEZI|nr:Glycoside Hydrolase Family 51 protein [Tuber magnatum]